MRLTCHPSGRAVLSALSACRCCPNGIPAIYPHTPLTLYMRSPASRPALLQNLCCAKIKAQSCDKLQIFATLSWMAFSFFCCAAVPNPELRTQSPNQRTRMMPNPMNKPTPSPHFTISENAKAKGEGEGEGEGEVGLDSDRGGMNTASCAMTWISGKTNFRRAQERTHNMTKLFVTLTAC